MNREASCTKAELAVSRGVGNSSSLLKGGESSCHTSEIVDEGLLSDNDDRGLSNGRESVAGSECADVVPASAKLLLRFTPLLLEVKVEDDEERLREFLVLLAELCMGLLGVWSESGPALWIWD